MIICLPSVERPGHLWGDSELEQGFAWSPGIVSLGVPEHAFVCLVELDVVDEFNLAHDAISCLRVPFDIFEAPIYVGSVFEYESVDIDKGNYSLVYEVLPGRGKWEIGSDGGKESGENSYILKIWLVRGDNASFEIIKVGGAIRADRVLRRLSKLA